MAASIITLSKESKPVSARIETPPLNSGDRLSRIEFERRYQAHPEIKKAELIEGVVYVASPIRYKQHGQPQAQIINWLTTYAAATPGVDYSGNVTLRLDFENEPEPDAVLRLDSEVGGQSSISVDDYLEGPPELIVEIAASSASYDMHDKKRVYARNGVLEYLVVQMYEKQIDWFSLSEGVYEALPSDETDLLHSKVFPGLWLRPTDFWAGDLAAMLVVLQEGLASPEHQTFVEQLKARKSAGG